MLHNAKWAFTQGVRESPFPSQSRQQGWEATRCLRQATLVTEMQGLRSGGLAPACAPGEGVEGTWLLPAALGHTSGFVDVPAGTCLSCEESLQPGTSDSTCLTLRGKLWVRLSPGPLPASEVYTQPGSQLSGTFPLNGTCEAMKKPTEEHTWPFWSLTAMLRHYTAFLSS